MGSMFAPAPPAPPPPPDPPKMPDYEAIRKSNRKKSAAKRGTGRASTVLSSDKLGG